jgi:protein-S-isoprenylcysteine O-methyltransferase Ste14
MQQVALIAGAGLMLLVLAVSLAWSRRENPDGRLVALGVAVAIGLTAALIALVVSVDLVPDEDEWLVPPLAIVGTTAVIVGVRLVRRGHLWRRPDRS